MASEDEARIEWLAEPVRLTLDPRFPPDPWDRVDIDNAFVGFGDGSPITWNGMIRLAKPGPPLPAELNGVSWRITFLSERFQVPGFAADLGTDEREDVFVDPPAAMLSVPTGATTVSGARDVGRTRLRALIGYVHLRTELLSGAELVWEGPAFRTSGGKARIGAGDTRAYVRISAETLEERRRILTPFDLSSLAQRHALALEWFGEAWRGGTTAVRFTNLWFSVVVTVDSTFSSAERRSVEQMERIRRYLLNLPISQDRRDHLHERFRQAYRLRNRLVHAGDHTGITPTALKDLADAASEFLLDDIGRT